MEESTLQNPASQSTPNPQPLSNQPVQPVTTPATPSPQTGPIHKSKAPLFIGLGLLGILIFATVGYVLFNKPDTTMTAVKPTPVAMKPTTIPTKAPVAADTESALPPGTNDNQLNQDMQTIDTSMSKADSGITDVDKGLNDQGDNLSN